MINGDPHVFLNIVYNGETIVYRYNEKKYQYQGYVIGNNYFMEVYQIFDTAEEELASEGFEWIHKSGINENPIKVFENAPIFEGKTFWDVEKEIEWLDD